MVNGVGHTCRLPSGLRGRLSIVNGVGHTCLLPSGLRGRLSM